MARNPTDILYLEIPNTEFFQSHSDNIYYVLVYQLTKPVDERVRRRAILNAGSAPPVSG